MKETVSDPAGVRDSLESAFDEVRFPQLADEHHQLAESVSSAVRYLLLAQEHPEEAVEEDKAMAREGIRDAGWIAYFRHGGQLGLLAMQMLALETLGIRVDWNKAQAEMCEALTGVGDAG